MAKQFLQIPIPLGKVKTLSSTAKLIWGILDNQCRLQKTGTCFITQETIAYLGGLSLRTVKNQLSELKKAGFITWKKGNGLKKKASEYFLNRDFAENDLLDTQPEWGRNCPITRGKNCPNNGAEIALNKGQKLPTNNNKESYKKENIPTSYLKYQQGFLGKKNL